MTNVAYQVVKGAIPQFTRALAREFAYDNIRVNCVAPGVVRTEFHATMSEEQKRITWSSAFRCIEKVRQSKWPK